MAKMAQSMRAAAPVAAAPADVLAAGAVVFRQGKQVLLVHRPRYDDWSFPKGKLDRGEHALSAAVREVQEETGLNVRLGPALPDQRYSVGKRMKTVRYWVGHAVGGDDISHYWPNHEIDDLRWVSLAKAPELLTYPHDRKTLRKARPWRQPTNTLVIVRHALARSRRAWREDDPIRPLLKTGQSQAVRLMPLLASYDVTRVVTSGSERCLRTVTPYAEQRGLKVRRRAELSEEGATPEGVSDVIGRLLARQENAVVCSHRPVLPWVCEALGIDAVKLDPGAFIVVHHRAGTVLATEHHKVR
jgi:8-oxo-(d)GTP phosphatase